MPTFPTNEHREAAHAPPLIQSVDIEVVDPNFMQPAQEVEAQQYSAWVI